MVVLPHALVYLDGCAMGVSSIQTPLGDIAVDDSLQRGSSTIGEFSIIGTDMDQREHSEGMQYPFSAKIFWIPK